MKADEAKKLLLFMDKEKLSQQDLATLIHKNQSDVSRYLNGKLKIPLEVWKVLHLKYGLRYDWIFHTNGPMKNNSKEKPSLIKDINEMNAIVAALTASQERLRLDFNKLHADFYENKHKK